MSNPQPNDQQRLAKQIHELYIAEIERLRRQCRLWGARCLLLTLEAELTARNIQEIIEGLRRAAQVHPSHCRERRGRRNLPSRGRRLW